MIGKGLNAFSVSVSQNMVERSNQNQGVFFFEKSGVFHQNSDAFARLVS
jgi:hypothetical protein